MLIICLEGPSAVGKSSTSKALQAQDGFTSVAEVNALFQSPISEPDDWYMLRQAERLAIARAESPAVLDGDPFQALWYAWTFPDFGEGLASVIAAYRQQVVSGAMAFPDAYFLLLTDEQRLRERKQGDTTRSRRNFEHHLRLLETLPRYFSALAKLLSGRVHIIQAESVEGNRQQILDALSSVPSQPIDHLAVYNEISGWLIRHSRNT